MKPIVESEGSELEITQLEAKAPQIMSSQSRPASGRSESGQDEAARVSLTRVVAYQLTGEWLDVTDAQPLPSPDLIARTIHEAGWSSARLNHRRAQTIEDGHRWPFAYPHARDTGIGFSQLWAITGEVIRLLQIGPVVRLRDTHQPLDARDRALLDQRPPHHGSVG